MYDLGDSVAQQLTTRDSSGNPADATTVVCTITLPDASTATPTVSHPSTGVYTISFPTTQAGRHLLRWVTTGPAQVQTDVFWVAPTDPGMIISLAEARLALRNVSSASTATDEDLRSLIVSATAPMEDLCGAIVPRSCDEWHDGGGRTIALLNTPLTVVSAVAESYGNFTRTLTLQELSGSSFDSYGYTVDLSTGILTRRTSGRDGAFAPGRRNVHVTYTAGRAVLPPNLISATRRLVRWLWQIEQQGQRPNGSAPDAATTSTPSGFQVPTVVKVLCAGELRTVWGG